MVTAVAALNGDVGWEEFGALLGGVVEHGAPLVAAVWGRRPFRDVNHLHDELCDVLDALPADVQKGVLRCHPDLAGRLAQLGQLTDESSREQAAGGIDNLTSPEKKLLDDLNSRYKSRFGFPFIICVRQNKKTTIFQELDRRLQSDKDMEVATAMGEVKKICYLRLLDILDHSDVTPKL